MVLPAQELKPAPPFSPIIAQYGINANEFCEKFNKESVIFPAGTPIPTSIFYIPKDKKFDFCWRPFQLKHILQEYVKFHETYRIYSINYLDLYKSVLIKSAVLNDKNHFRVLRNIIGTLKSYERPLVIGGLQDPDLSIFINEQNLLEPQKEITDTEQSESEDEEFSEKEEEDLYKEKEILKGQALYPDLDIKTYNLFQDYYEKYCSIRKIPSYKNKRRVAAIVKKKNRQRSFALWYGLPYSILIYTPKIRLFHLMQTYLYKLKDCVIVRKQRFFYKKDYSKKDVTSFFTYRIYCSDIYKLYEYIEEVIEYDITILGIEIHNKTYPIEYLPQTLTTLKEDLKFFFNILNTYNKDFINTTIKEFNNLDNEYNNNNFEFLQICQHIIK